MPETDASAAWVEKAQAGDLDAFEVLYRRHRGRIYALCLRMCGNVHEAEEATQEVFIRAWEKLPTFRGASAFSSWLHRLAVNVVLAGWRARGRRPEHGEVVDLAAVPADASPDGGAIDLERAIARLPRGARTVFVLHDVEGYLHQEIAEMTGLATGTSKAQLHRARRLLRRALGAAEDVPK